MARLIHELEVHQIELRMQNDELRRIQGELEKTRDSYSHLYDFAPVGYFTLSEKGLIEETNLTLVSMLGIERSALIGKPFSRFVRRDDQDSFYKHRQRLLETESSLSCELRLVKKDGDEFYARIESMVIISRADDLRQIRAAVSDITERKQAETILQRERETLSTILESNPHGIALIDKRGKYLYLNPMFTKITGYTVEDFQVWRDWFHKAYPDSEYRKTVIDALKKDSMKEGVGGDFEFKVTCKDGTEKDIGFRTTYLEDRRISVLTDLTDRNRAGLAIRESERLTGVIEMAGTVCHEMNQPMQAILGYSELLMLNIKENDPLFHRLKRIKDKIERMGTITQKLAGVTKYETKDYLNDKIIDIDKAGT